MSTPHDVSDTVVQVSTDGTTWATVWGVTSYDADHGTEGFTRRRIFGQAVPVVRVGEDTDTYDFDGLLDLSDTDGQNVLRTARDNRTPVQIRILPSGLGAGKKGYSQEGYVTAYGDSGDADGDFVECSFSLEGSGVKTNLTLV